MLDTKITASFFIFCFLVALIGMHFILRVPDTENIDTTAIHSVQVENIVPLETKLGQLFMIGHWADTPVASTTNLIEKYQPAGVVIMSAPENPGEISDWVKRWNSVSELPLLIAVDQEGGPVTRLKGSGFTQTGQRDISTSDQAYAVGLARGQELSALGINMNFAPVLDTAKDSDSFMYSRTFPEGTNPAALATSLSKGMEKSGVIAVPKHFPGHDDTSVDSHNELPIVDITQSELSIFTQPFEDMLNSDSPKAIMTAHVQFPQIDSMPATLSYFFLTSYLREQLQYSGIIITDDMSMDAIDTYYNTSAASTLAIKAGADIILLAAEPTSINDIFPKVLELATSSTTLQNQIKNSYERITKLK
jgi:beta-N-acetylhexosaminidase